MLRAVLVSDEDVDGSVNQAIAFVLGTGINVTMVDVSGKTISDITMDSAMKMLADRTSPEIAAELTADSAVAVPPGLAVDQQPPVEAPPTPVEEQPSQTAPEQVTSPVEPPPAPPVVEEGVVPQEQTPPVP